MNCELAFSLHLSPHLHCLSYVNFRIVKNLRIIILKPTFVISCIVLYIHEKTGDRTNSVCCWSSVMTTIVKTSLSPKVNITAGDFTSDVDKTDINTEVRDIVENVFYTGLSLPVCLTGIPANIINCLVFWQLCFSY